jgi:hypothetical protein
MESTASPLETAKKTLIEEGFVDLGDSSVGQHVCEFEQKEFPFYTEDGMDFLMQHILTNLVSKTKHSLATSNILQGIRSIVDWFFGHKGCVLIH